MAFKQIRVSPIMDLDAYTAEDVMFPLTEIQLPSKRACKLINITVINRAGTAADGWNMHLLFLNDNSQELGTVQATAGTLTYQNARDSVLSYVPINSKYASAANDFDNFTITSSSSYSGFFGDGNSSILLEPKSGNRSIWFSATAHNDTPTFAGVTGVRVNNASNYGADSSTTIIVDAVDATLHFKAGDTVVDADDVVIGVVDSVTANLITLTTNNIGALTDDDYLFTPHQLEFIFDLEY